MTVVKGVRRQVVLRQGGRAIVDRTLGTLIVGAVALQELIGRPPRIMWVREAEVDQERVLIAAIIPLAAAAPVAAALSSGGGGP